MENADATLLFEDNSTMLRLCRIKVLISAVWIMMYNLVSRHNVITLKIPLLWQFVLYELAKNPELGSAEAQ